MEGIFNTAIVFATIYGIIFLFIRKRERMALIDRGLDPKSFEQPKDNYSTLRYGLLFTGIGFGILLANIIVAAEMMESAPAYFSLISLFGGVSLIIDYILEKQLVKKSKQHENYSEVV